MKIYTLNPGPLTRAFLQVFGLSSDQREVATPEEADIVLVTGTQVLRDAFQRHGGKFFAVLSAAKTDLQPAQPENVFVMDSLNLFKEERGVSAMLACHKAWSAKRATVAAETTLPVPSDLAKLSRSYMVLVVDDSVQNLSLAAMVLPGQKIAVAQNLADALRLLSLGGDKFDAVLTDLNMPPDKAYPALNLERYGVTDTVPAGIALMLEDTPRGIPVAIATDANPHQDFFSAMFDCVKGAEVNGQKVLFRGDSGKRWDRALQALLEPDAPGE